MSSAPKPRRALAFLLYDPEGLCDQSTLRTLEGFRPFIEHLLVVSNGALQRESRDAVAAIADDVIERDNVGFDVGAYRDALSHIGWDALAEFDELLMVNYTFFGPVGSFEPVLDRMWEEPVDLWGITDHPSVTPDPITGKGTMPAHLQSFWLGVRNPILKDNAFRRFWLDLPDPNTYEQVIANFETRFTQHFARLGFKWKAAYPAARYGVRNSAMEAPLALLQDGCPLFKKRLYFHDAPWLARQGVFSGAVTAEAVRRGYPEELVLQGVYRRASARELSFGMDATFAAPDLAKPASETVAAVTGQPWKKLCEVGADGLLSESHILIVDADAPVSGGLSDGALSSYNYAHTAIVDSVGTIEEQFASHPEMAAIFPYMDLLSDPVIGRQWFARTQVAAQVATALGLSGPFSHTSVLAPYRGIAAYRRGLLEAVSSRIEAAGGWSALSELAGGDQELSQILDLLAGDIAKEEGWFVGQMGTECELRRSASLLQDAYSRKPFVQPGYLDYPYSGRVIMPGIKNRIGAAVKNASPSTFERLHSAELQLRSMVQKDKGGLK